jgi:signal transduction histidine kinase
MSSRAQDRLNAIIASLQDATSRRDVASDIAREIASELGSEFLALYLWYETDAALRTAASWGDRAAGGEEPAPERMVPAEHFGPAARARRQSRWRTADSGVTDLVPFVCAGRFEGALLCRWASGASPTASQRKFIDELAPQIAVALRCLRLEEERVRSERRLAELARLSVDLLAADDLQTSAIRVCEATRVIFGVTRSALFLLDEGQLVPHAIAGPYGERAGLGQLHLPPSAEPGFEEALRTHEVLVVNDFAQSRYAPTPFPVPYRPAAAMVIPLVDGAGVLGILTASELEEPKRFEPRDAVDGKLLGAIATGAVRKGLLLADLQQASSAKSEFLASVSHELRTPLNVFLGYTEMLTEGAFGPVNPEQVATLDRMSQTARSQIALVDDLLDISRIEQGKLDVRRETFRLAELVDALRGAMMTLLRGRPIDFLTDVPDDISVWTDRDRLRQVLVNLLSNAAKFTTEGSISLIASHWDGGVEVTIADTGIGIDVAVQGRETEPFVAGTHAGAGAGLGLAIVSRIMRALEANFTIESAVGRGTTARLRLRSRELREEEAARAASGDATEGRRVEEV